MKKEQKAKGDRVKGKVAKEEAEPGGKAQIEPEAGEETEEPGSDGSGNDEAEPAPGTPSLLYNTYFWLAIAGGVILVLAMGVLLAPEVFWDGFLWKYYISAVVADAEEQSGNEYNPVDTTTYGIILAVSVFLVYKLMKRWKVHMGTGFFLAVLPFIILGGFARVMEDSGLFEPPLRYMFITPGMWILTGLGTLAFLACAHYITALNGTRGHTAATLGLAAVLGGFFGLHAAMTEGLPGQFNATIPHWVAGSLVAVTFAGLLYHSLRIGPLERGRGEGEEKEGGNEDEAAEDGGWYSRTAVFFGFGALLLSMPVYLVITWLSDEPWTQKIGENHVTHWEVLPQSVVLAVIATAVVAVAAQTAAKRWKSASIFGTGTASVLFFSHFLDAAATYIGIELHGYTEMHVLPTFLIELTGSALVMFPLKFVVVAVVIWFLDVEYRDEMLKRPQLFGMVKLCVAILGLAPGIRDALRTSMGV